MYRAIVSLVTAATLLMAPITSVVSPTPEPSPSTSESSATTPATVDPPLPDPEPSPSTPPSPEEAPEVKSDLSDVPPPPQTPPPADLGEQVEDAIEEQEQQVEPEVVPFDAPPAVASPTLQCYGDSLLGSVCGSDASSPLGALLPGWTTKDYSLGGHHSGAIAVNAGAYRLQLTQPVTIAASGDTNLPQPYLAEIPSDMIGGLSIRVSIAGVTGGLINRPDLGIVWRFVRDTAGAAVEVPAGTAIESLSAMAPGAASIIWAGTNNLTAPDQILADVEAMVALHRSISDQPYWVVSVTPAWGNSASIYGISRAKVNKELDKRYGDRYVPLDEYIGNGAITDSGNAPTSADRDWIAAGLNPPVFHSSSDWIHFNATGRGAVARFLERFVAKGTTASQQRALFNAEASLAVDVYGATIVVRGWAFDRSDLYQRIPVGITIDDRWMLGTYADQASPELAKYGVPSNHGFSWSTKLADGRTYKICNVGVNIGAGQNAYPPCVSVTIPTLLPQGDVDLIDVGNGTMAVVGWGFDHADLYAHIPVGVIIDGRWHAGVTASMPSPYLRPYGVPGDHAFFVGAQVGRGTHSVCAVGVSVATGRNATLGCDSITLR